MKFLDRIAERIVPSEEDGAELTNRIKWAEIKNGQGECTGYIELFWAGKLGWVSIPGASRVIEPGSEIPS
jgi:hypothetical protein